MFMACLSVIVCPPSSDVCSRRFYFKVKSLLVVFAFAAADVGGMLVMDGSVRRFLLQTRQMAHRNGHNREVCTLNRKKHPSWLSRISGQANPGDVDTWQPFILWNCAPDIILFAVPPLSLCLSESDLPAACVPSPREWIWTVSKRL